MKVIEHIRSITDYNTEINICKIEYADEYAWLHKNVMLCDRLKNITIEFLLEYLDCEVIEVNRYYYNIDDGEKVFLTIK